MTLQGLRCFAEVSKCSSYAEAARRLYVSQPAVTHQIQQLERELNIRLLDRTRSLVRLTPAGAVFYADVERILNALDSAVDRIQNNIQFTAMLSVGCERTIQLRHLPRIFREFQACCPTVCVNTTEVPATERKKLLQSGQLDIAFFSKPGIEGMPGIRYAKLFQGHFCCVLPAGHPLENRTEILPEDLAGETLIFIDALHCPPEMEPVQEELRRKCRAIRLYLSSSSIATAAMIQGGLGVAIMPNYVCPGGPGLVTVPYCTSHQVEYGLTWHSGDSSQKVKEFVRIALRAYSKEHPKEV